MKMRISGSHVLTFCHNTGYTFLFLYVSLSGIPLFMQRTGCLGQAACFPGGGGTQQIFLRGGSTPKVQPLTLLYVIFTKKVPLWYTLY